MLRAAAIAIISVIGMAYLQELLPGQAGIVAALFGSTASAAGLLSGMGTGLWAQYFGYWSMFPPVLVSALSAWRLVFANKVDTPIKIGVALDTAPISHGAVVVRRALPTLHRKPRPSQRPTQRASSLPSEVSS